MQQQPIDRLLGVLETLAARPQNYVRPVEVATVRSFLDGMATGCAFAGVPFDYPQLLTFVEAAIEARGWEWTPASRVEQQMRARGIDEASIIQELIALQIDVFRLAAGVPRP